MDEIELRLSESLLKQRLELLKLRKPTWVLKNIWVVPVFTGLVLLTTKGYRSISILLIILASFNVLYSVFTYFIWKNWLSKSDKRKLQSVKIIMIYDGFFLGTLSILFFVAANYSLQRIDPIWLKPAGLYSSILYLLLSVFILFNGKRIVKHLIDNRKKPLASQTKFALSIPSLLIGTGIVLGAVLRTSDLGTIIAVGFEYLGAYLLLPFAVTVFFQVFVLIREI